MPPIPFSFIKSSTFDPATLSLSGWWRTNYGGSPWTGNASAGASNGRSLTEATNPPTGGTAVNGLTPALFNGTTNQLSTALTINDFGPSAISIVALVKMVALAADDAGMDVQPKIFCDTGSYLNLLVETSGVRFGFYNGGIKQTADVAISTGVWTMVRAKWDGTNLFCATNANAFAVGVASGAPDVLTGTMNVGRNYNATSFLSGNIAELMVSSTALSDANFNNIRSYFNARYALAL